MDDVSLSLIPFQQFLNVYYENELDVLLRCDGYLDLETKEAITLFQTEHNLLISGTLTMETAHKIYDLYLTYLNDWTYDHQLLTLIETIKG